jgi:HK97 family phage prohead protease
MTDFREFREGLNVRQRRALEVFERRCGAFGERETRTAPLDVEETADSGNPNVAYITKGHAAVYNRKSLDLGGFQEIVAPGAFDEALDRNPDVHLVWDHDLSRPLARTLSTQYLLELRSDPRGLHFYAKVAPTSFASDLRILMEGGVVDQASFAFTVQDDEWQVVNRDKPDEYVLRTITRVGELFDVTITAQGAYPQTDSQVVRDYALAYAQANGRLEESGSSRSIEITMTGDADALRGAVSEAVAPTAPQVETPEEPAVGAEDQPPLEPEGGDPSLDTEGGDVVLPQNPVLLAARKRAKQRVELLRLTGDTE